mmetsp:Transcript_30919/g.44420  ORF Transcript_30919/g.44420 Transcript_30919/m.44420 type:complete len:167 (-) Transcript_30919:92-592(-)
MVIPVPPGALRMSKRCRETLEVLGASTAEVETALRYEHRQKSIAVGFGDAPAWAQALQAGQQALQAGQQALLAGQEALLQQFSELPVKIYNSHAHVGVGSIQWIILPLVAFPLNVLPPTRNDLMQMGNQQCNAVMAYYGLPAIAGHSRADIEAKRIAIGTRIGLIF